jgi:hypothetical protein
MIDYSVRSCCDMILQKPGKLSYKVIWNILAFYNVYKGAIFFPLVLLCHFQLISFSHELLDLK